jgi:multimeric flavodoxin WrbA
MGAATIAIPTRWEKATFQIKQFIEDQARQFDVRFEVILTGQWDAGQIYIIDDSLASSERVVCQNAISAMNDRLNLEWSDDAWQARRDLNEESRKQLEEIREIVERAVREREG